jgi:DNA-binding beta-propeller fold protein YncE
MAQTLGMVMDNTSDSAIVFDADLDVVLASVPIPPGPAIGDCSIKADQSLGFATGFTGKVIVVDLTTLSLVPEPIHISNFGEDTSISPDGNFLVVANGAKGVFPISVVDIATQMQISTINFSGANHNSVDVCSDGSVLATSFDTGTLYRGTIDGGGIITNTGEMLAIPSPNNVSCAPGAQAGLTRRGTGSMSEHQRRSTSSPLTPIPERWVPRRCSQFHSSLQAYSSVWII